MARRGSTDEQVEALVPAAAGGDEAAWRELWELLEPRLFGLVRQPRFSGPLSQSDDDCRNVVLEVMSRLRENDRRRLKLFLETHRDKPSVRFMPWLVVVAKRIAIDHLRAHGQYIDKRGSRNDGSAAGEWVAPGTLPTDSRLPGGRPPFTRRGTAMEMLRYAGLELPAPQREALELWIQSEDYDEIAARLELGSGKDAERLVRAALERLRREFRKRETTPP